MTCGAVRPGQCTPRKPCTPLGWCAELPRHPLDVSDLYSATPNSIWAAGTTVMHWDGTSWSTVGLDAGGISSTVWGFGDDDVWVGGQNLSHWDGFEWKTLAAPGFGFRGIHGTRPDDVWFTEMRAVLRWNGRSFTRWDVGMPQSTFVPGEVWSFSAQDVWAGSFHFTGSAWVVYQPQPIINYGPDEVWGAAPNDLWGVVPQTSQIWHWDGGAWSLARDNELPSSVYGTAADDVWFTSRDVLHFDGVQLSPVMPNRFTTVFALERGKPLLANYFGEVVRLELDAGVTTLSAPLSSPIVDATWTTSDGWAVSDRALLRFDGTFWRDAPLPPTSGHLTAVAAAGAYAWVGTRNATSLGGELLTWDGATWSSALLSSVVDALWANSPTDVWVFCRDELRHWDGVIWTSTPRPAAMRSPVLEAWSNGTMLVALTTGSFLSWNGSMWTEEQLAPSGTLRSFAVRSPSDMWAVGASVVFHFDGTFWNVVSFRPPDPMIGVAAVGNRKAWLFTETQIYEVNLAMPPPLRLINTDLEPTTFRSVEHSGNEFRVMTTNSILRAP